jgi:RNA polymerase sigma-70 factor (ECF subfamily)
MPAEDISTLSLKVAEHDDEAAFDKLFLHFYPGLFSFALAYVKNRDWATEVTEDVLINLWENRKVLPAIKNLTYYLYVAAKNASLNCLKKNRRNETVDLDDVMMSSLQFQGNPENRMISKEVMWDIEKAIGSLPAKCRLIFRLVKGEGLKYREVAELLGISIKTVETQMAIALRKIKEALALHMNDRRRRSSQ